jgi:hypothetical protein
MADRTTHPHDHSGGKCHCNDPLTQVQLDVMASAGCSIPGCPCKNMSDGFYFGQLCCEGAGHDIRYFEGVLWITCHHCEGPVAKVSVAKV